MICDNVPMAPSYISLLLACLTNFCTYLMFQSSCAANGLVIWKLGKIACFRFKATFQTIIGTSRSHWSLDSTVSTLKISSSFPARALGLEVLQTAAESEAQETLTAIRGYPFVFIFIFLEPLCYYSLQCMCHEIIPKQ